MRRIKSTSVFRDRIAFLELLNQSLRRKMLNKSPSVFLIDKLLSNFADNRIVRRKFRGKRITHIDRLALDYLDKRPNNFPFGKIHLEVTVGLIKNSSSIKFFVQGTLQTLSLHVQIHRRDFLTHFFFGRFLD